MVIKGAAAKFSFCNSPFSVGGATRIWTGESRICSPLPYHLAMAPYTGFAGRCARKSDFCGAAYEARTRYLHLGKVALYRMS